MTEERTATPTTASATDHDVTIGSAHHARAGVNTIAPAAIAIDRLVTPDPCCETRRPIRMYPAQKVAARAMATSPSVASCPASTPGAGCGAIGPFQLERDAREQDHPDRGQGDRGPLAPTATGDRTDRDRAAELDRDCGAEREVVDGRVEGDVHGSEHDAELDQDAELC